MTSPRLEVLICAYGRDALQRLDVTSYPVTEEVGYLVSWQLPDGDAPVPVHITARTDFRVCKHTTRGLSRNRNHAFDAARGALLLISDDDVAYTPRQLQDIMLAAEHHPRADVLTFNFYSPGRAPKPGADRNFDLRNAPRGYYVSSVEMAVRRCVVEAGLRFDERFGINAQFPFGEEEVFVSTVLRRGGVGIHLPVTICTHADLSTCQQTSPAETARTKGAVHRVIHPATWPLRMITQAIGTGLRGFFPFCRSWLRGARQAKEKTCHPCA